jgi:hypothetical protein
MREMVEGRIRHCYESKDKLLASERQQWFSLQMKDLIQKDSKYLKAWLNNVERLFRIIRRQEKQRPSESRLMEKFLSISQTDRQVRARQNKSRKPRKLTQDMQPD